MNLASLLTSLAIVATPGTGAILTISAGLRTGRRSAMVTAVGCTIGIVPHLAVAITGTAMFLRAGGVAFEVLKVLGVLHLLYLAWVTWRDDGVLSVGSPSARAGVGRTIINAVLANLLNPKLTLFFFAFLPQFVRPDGSALGQMALLSAIFMAMTLVVFAGYGWFAAAMRDRVITRPRVVRWVQRVFSLSYLALGAKLATVER